MLEGKTKGYKNDPQLSRFKKLEYPLAAITVYLYQIYLEAKKRDYKFDRAKIETKILKEKILVNSGQVSYELVHRLKKLNIRDKKHLKK